MAYFPRIEVIGSSNGGADAFGRLRMAEPFTVFDSKQLYDTGSLFWSSTASYGATITHATESATVTLTVPATLGATAARQTRQYFNYQPGKSHLIITTGNFGVGVSGIAKRMGYFTSKNGLFFEQSGSDIYVVKRDFLTQTPRDTKVSQSAWNLDTMDGNGPSGINIDFSKSQIYFTDMEWLGVGRVRYGMYYGGLPYYVHEFTHANELDTVYMSSPNLPVRYEIVNNTGTNTSSLKHICSTVVSEGGFEQHGVIRSISNGSGSISVASNDSEVLIALRLKPERIDSSVYPIGVTVLTTTANANGRWALILNPVVTGTAFDWKDVDDSSLQYSLTDNTLVDIAPGRGTTIASGYISNDASATSDAIESALTLGSDINGEPGVLALVITSLGGTYAWLGSLTVRVLQ